MLAPLAASLSRYGACPLPMTLVRCLFSKITTTMWSGTGTAAFGLPGAGRRTVDFGFVGENGRSTALTFGEGCTTAVVVCGFAGATAGMLREGPGTGADGGFATAQAAGVNSKTPATTQPVHRGKARTWNPLKIQVLAKHHSTSAWGHAQTSHWLRPPYIRFRRDERAPDCDRPTGFDESELGPE